MTFRTIFLVYAAIMTAVIGSIVFNAGAMYRNILREGVVTKGRVTSIQRDFPGNKGKLRAHIDWSVPGRASTLTTLWRKGPFSEYSVGSEVDLIIHNGEAYFLNEARAVGRGWLLWAGWALIVGAPGILFYFLGLFRAKLDVQSETLPRNEKHHSRRVSNGSSSSVLPEPPYISSDYSVPNQVSNPKQFQPKKIIIPAIFLIGFLVLDFIYARWALLSEPQGDVLGRVVVGLLLGIATVLAALTVQQRIAAAIKGSLRIIFTDRPYSWGETLSGNILLHTRERLLFERLTITLSAQQRISGGSQNSTQFEKVIHLSQDLPIDENHLPGIRQIPFSIKIPNRPVRHTPEWPDELKGVGAFIEGVQRTFNALDLAPELDWTLEACAHLPGADLDDSHTLRFNSSSVIS